MLSEQIDELIDSLPRQPYGTGSRREDCRELVREVRKQDTELIRQMLEALSVALSDVDWRAGSPTQNVIHKAYNAARARLENT